MRNFLLCLIYAATLGLVSFLLGRELPKSWLHPDQFPFRTYAWEETLWKALQIRKWQAKVPDMSKVFPKLMPAKALTQKTAQDLPLMIQETCVAELVHDILSILTFGCVWIWPGWGLWLSIAYVLIGHLPYIVIQRYNRPRLARMHALLKAREDRSHADKDA